MLRNYKLEFHVGGYPCSWERKAVVESDESSDAVTVLFAPRTAMEIHAFGCCGTWSVYFGGESAVYASVVERINLQDVDQFFVDHGAVRFSDIAREAERQLCIKHPQTMNPV